MKTLNYSETKAVYGIGEETDLQRQLREFFSPSPRRACVKVASWAPGFDILNGAKAGKKEKLGPFGKVIEQ